MYEPRLHGPLQFSLVVQALARILGTPTDILLLKAEAPHNGDLSPDFNRAFDLLGRDLVPCRQLT